LSCCVEEKKNKVGEIIGLDLLEKYVDRFNENNNELYKQFFSNEEAFPFLSENIPIVDLPDKVIEETYYFRWWTYRKHIKNTDDGFVITEFLPDVYWSKKHNTINCPAAHHIYEGRSLRDSRYISDYINFWVNNSEDGIRQYSFWVADATLAFNSIHRNDSILSKQLGPLIKNYNEWENTRKDIDKLLFWQYDINDGMEYTASGRILNREIEKFGVEATRPTINSYMYGDAAAISKISLITNNLSKSQEFGSKANKIKHELQKRLWNKDLNFFTVLPKNHNKTSKPLDVRELIGYVPWYFNLPDDKVEYSQAWKKIKDTTGFSAPFGLTVTEQSHPFFKISYEGHECQWNRPSWPFATTQTLKAMANFLNNYSNNKTISKQDYYNILLQYANQHKLKNDKGETVNWIDENLNPYTGDWISRTRLINWEGKGWSEEKGGVERGKDYNHSGFCDLVLSDLLGINPNINNSIEINPLIPSDWEWFAAENIPFQGKEISLVWDKTGKHYNLVKGLMLFIDKKLTIKKDKIQKIIFTQNFK
tara:strand:- start:548 stop:2155 length:1608 start_codon:yes stop_codon:yes gene_type:complete